MLKGKGVRLAVDEPTRDLIAQDVFDLSLSEGARAAPRAVNRRLITPVIDFLLEKDFAPVESEIVDLRAVVEGGRVVIEHAPPA